MPAQIRFKRIYLETFGSQASRIKHRPVPRGRPEGHGSYESAIERKKLVYILKRNGQAGLIISSPLDTCKPQILVLPMVALDVMSDMKSNLRVNQTLVSWNDAKHPLLDGLPWTGNIYDYCGPTI